MVPLGFDTTQKLVYQEYINTANSAHITSPFISGNCQEFTTKQQHNKKEISMTYT